MSSTGNGHYVILTNSTGFLKSTLIYTQKINKKGRRTKHFRFYYPPNITFTNIKTLLNNKVLHNFKKK